MTPTTEQAVEVLDPERFLVAYKPYKAVIAELTQKYQGVQFDVETSKGLEAAKTARREILDPVYATEKLRKQLKAPALEFSRRIDGDAKEIDTALRALAEPIEAQIKAREAAIEAEKEAKRQAEIRRQQEITSRISGIRDHITDAAGQPSAQIAQVLADLHAYVPTLDVFGDRAGEAQLVLDETRKRLAEMQAQAEQREAEAARQEAERKAEAERLAAERAELARQRAEQEERERVAREQREADERAAAQARAAEEAKLQAEREALAAERRAEEERQAAARAEEQRRQEAAAAELHRQQEEVNRQRREVEMQQEAQRRAEQERIDAEARAQALAQAAAEAAEHERLAEAARREAAQFALTGPGDVEIVRVLAEHYDVEIGDVMEWLKAFDYAATDEHFAATNMGEK